MLPQILYDRFENCKTYLVASSQGGGMGEDGHGRSVLNPKLGPNSFYTFEM